MNDPFAIANQVSKAPLDPFLLASLAATDMPAASAFGYGGGRAEWWGGDKFAGGFGPTKILTPDYWELRARSAQLFTENLYARGLIRRLITNEINVGLTLESEPIDELLEGIDEEAAEDWANDTEDRFEVWADNPNVCDFEGRRTFGELQQVARTEALVEGDVLCVLRADRRTGLQRVQLIRGGRVMTPIKRSPDSRAANIVNGVELDADGRHVAYWVTDRNLESTRIAAFGRRSKRRTAWLVYGTDRRMDSVRGVPLLSLILQSIKELDRYRDSEQRAATINALLAMYIQKSDELAGTRPFSGGAVRNVLAQTTDVEGGRTFNIAEQVPGVVYEELQKGEEPVSFNTSRPNVNYGTFEAAVVHAIAWANEIPPEILTLAFSNNYSASKAAINEFKSYIVRARELWGKHFCQPIYVEWLIAETLQDAIAAPGFLEAWRNPREYVTFGAWTRSTWGGPVKPSVELKKDIDAYSIAIENNLISHDRASKDIFGTRFKRVQKRLKRERRVLADNRSELGEEGMPETDVQQVDPGTGLTNAQRDNVVELVTEEVRENA